MSIKTPETDPNHMVIGHYFKTSAGSAKGTAIYFCDSYDPAVDFWMTPVTRTKEVQRTNVSPRAIDRTFHTVYEDRGNVFCTWGPLIAEEIDAIRRHQTERARK